jgi:hypothetical protein
MPVGAPSVSSVAEDDDSDLPDLLEDYSINFNDSFEAEASVQACDWPVTWALMIQHLGLSSLGTSAAPGSVPICLCLPSTGNKIVDQLSSDLYGHEQTEVVTSAYEAEAAGQAWSLLVQGAVQIATIGGVAQLSADDSSDDEDLPELVPYCWDTDSRRYVERHEDVDCPFCVVGCRSARFCDS